MIERLKSRPEGFFILNPYRIYRIFLRQQIRGRYTPVIGDLLNVARAKARGEMLQFMDKMFDEYGQYYHSSLGPVARFLTCDPSIMQYVLKKNVKSYHKSLIMKYILGTLLGMENLLMAEDEVHQLHRRIIGPVFQHQNLISMLSLMTDKTELIINKWKRLMDETTKSYVDLDFHVEMANLTLDIVCGCLFGTDLINNIEIHRFIYNSVTNAYRETEKRLFNMIGIIPILKDLPLPSKLRMDKGKQEVKKVILKIIKDRKDGHSSAACKGETSDRMR
ncbi:unnamed protein product [Didymodactylos carnosus]|uniref:Cytochrome P450 n=1 Tax=Didymodactylos carnosus TaxID=1234261 RepID=A0A8S2E6I8_9BILA|nr:unnamed protein product [Didymodactylos carnosus]CAF3947029.1 unnamed protein product [Didymodactylos carnosus]